MLQDCLVERKLQGWPKVVLRGCLKEWGSLKRDPPKSQGVVRSHGGPSSERPAVPPNATLLATFFLPAGLPSGLEHTRCSLGLSLCCCWGPADPVSSRVGMNA